MSINQRLERLEHAATARQHADDGERVTHDAQACAEKFERFASHGFDPQTWMEWSKCLEALEARKQ